MTVYGNGYIQFHEKLNESQKERVAVILGMDFHHVKSEILKIGGDEPKTTFSFLYENENYTTAFVLDTLYHVNYWASIEIGEVAFFDTDNNQWRFRFIGDKWEEEKGEVVY